MKALSFLPAATDIIYQLGLDYLLYGVTFECPSDKPKVVRSLLENQHLSSEEIDRVVAESKATGKCLYYVDEALLQAIEPDIIFTQDVCEVCQIDTAKVECAVNKLRKKPLLVPLLPRSLEDIFDNIHTIAKALNKEENARILCSQLHNRINNVAEILALNNAPTKKVVVLEWINPLYNCGHWIPEQIERAGGKDFLANPKGYSVKIEWKSICKYNPEIIVITPCGFDVERVEQEFSFMEKLPGWFELEAVQSNQVYIADSRFFTCPGTTVIGGIELLAYIFHPSLFGHLAPVYRPYVKRMNTKAYACQ
ncbi:MAG: ABC transporter substrate-binding protein [Chitinophagales bacterium]|nr:ABC transporter substrate-binding protein [Chitinophagales bacterium]